MRRNRELERSSNTKQTNTYTSYVCNQDLATPKLQDQPDTQNRTDHAHHAICNLSRNRSGSGHARVFKNLRRVVHNGINARSLVNNGEENTNQHKLSKPGDREHIPQALVRLLSLSFMLTSLNHFHEFIFEGTVTLRVTDTLERGNRIVHTYLRHVPA